MAHTYAPTDGECVCGHHASEHTERRPKTGGMFDNTRTGCTKCLFRSPRRRRLAMTPNVTTAPMQEASFHRGVLAALWQVTAHDAETMHAEIVDMAGLRNLLAVVEDEADAEMAGLLKYDHCRAAARRHLRTIAARGVEPCYRDGCPNVTTTPRGYGECFCSADCADAAFAAKG